MAAARLSKCLKDLVLELIFMSVGDIHAFKAGMMHFPVMTCASWMSGRDSHACQLKI